MKNVPETNPTIPPSDYTREYFEACCQGYQEFDISQGQTLPLRLEIPLIIADIRTGMRVVDIGCGRGEIVLHCAQRGAYVWGLDYARNAVEIASETLNNIATPNLSGKYGIQQANACQLPIKNNSVDIVFMLDIVEHLYPQELKDALDEVWRILKPGGHLIIHTMPNLWYYRFGYPIYRWLQRLRGQQLPENPRDRWPFSHVHVNEQTPIKLKNYIQRSRFRSRIWLMSTHTYEYENNLIIRLGMRIVTSLLPLRLIFCNDIFADGEK